MRPVASLCRRELLLENWRLCCRHPGDAGPPASEKSAWTPLVGLRPAAGALRDLGQWSIDGPAARFDAQDWWYCLNFDLRDGHAGERVVLGFDGLATIAQVWLNGKPLLASSNMFVSHECDVSDVIRNKDNELLIHFGALDIQLAMQRRKPRWRVPMVTHQQLRWFRTTLLGRTPGWSLPAAVVGPWRDIWLEQRGPFEVKDLHVEVSAREGAGQVKCRVEFAAASGQAVDAVVLELERGGQRHTHRLTAGDAANTFAGDMRLDKVDLWWPHTHGEPALYRAALKVSLAGQAAVASVDLGRVGFRSITLDTADGDFSLKVNGVAIFCRGACWTPLDPVTLRSSPEECRVAVSQACAAGMNMLRVAGTMVYEEDHFFDACDELGMLVWQDFMFANMDYPAEDPAFMASVTLEVRQQLCRLQSSACLAVLCGNSEVGQQAAMWGALRELWQPALFVQTLARLCAAHAPGTVYWPSSAHGGAFPSQANAGTTSYYGVGAYLRPLEDARRAHLKFATECLAFANIPAPSAITRMPGGSAVRVHHPAWKERSPRDLGAGWDFDDVRDHYLSAVFKTDPQKLRYSDHERYLTLGRMTTGEVMAASFAEWRRPASSCRGAMVLFLRDFRAGAGWGLLDDKGCPKACYHYLKRVLQPLAVLLSDEGVNGLFAHVINERGEGRQLELGLAAWRDGDVCMATGKKTITVPARSAQSMSCQDLLGYFVDLTHAYRFGPMACDAVVVTLADEQGTQLSSAVYFPGGLDTTCDADLGLSAQACMTGDHNAELTVHARRFARGVHLDIPGFQADDDYFHLPPGTSARIALRGDGTSALAGFVHAANSTRSARIDVVVAEATAQRAEAV